MGKGVLGSCVSYTRLKLVANISAISPQSAVNSPLLHLSGPTDGALVFLLLMYWCSSLGDSFCGRGISHNLIVGQHKNYRISDLSHWIVLGQEQPAESVCRRLICYAYKPPLVVFRELGGCWQSWCGWSWETGTYWVIRVVEQTLSLERISSTDIWNSKSQSVSWSDSFILLCLPLCQEYLTWWTRLTSTLFSK